MKCNQSNAYHRTQWQRPYGPPIRTSGGFEKKELSDYKIDLSAFCEFDCGYCSSPTGNLLRINQRVIGDWTEAQTGVRLSPRYDADKFWIEYPKIIEKLCEQVHAEHWMTRTMSTLQFGMLVDNFSPTLVKEGITYEALKILLEGTSFRIRILTKSAAVAQPQFVRLFCRHPGRVTVGTSCGALDYGVMRTVEAGTSSPVARARAIRALQEAGVTTFGMFCPVLPGFHDKYSLSQLLNEFSVSKLERIWVEPYNNRGNPDHLRKKIMPFQRYGEELEAVLDDHRAWARYALDLAKNFADLLIEVGYRKPFVYLLYEAKMTADEIAEAASIPGVSFQSDPTRNVVSPKALLPNLDRSVAPVGQC